MLTVEAIVVAGSQWGTMAITTGAIVLLGASAAFAWGLYQAATVGLLLAVVGVLAHAVAALVRREAPDSQSVPPRPEVQEAASIYQKLGVDARTAAVAVALQRDSTDRAALGRSSAREGD